MIIPLFAIAISTVYFLSDYFTLLYRLLKKMTKKTNTYKVPQLVAHDYPLPPFPNTWYPICLSSELKTNAVQKKKSQATNSFCFATKKALSLQSTKIVHIWASISRTGP